MRHPFKTPKTGGTLGAPARETLCWLRSCPYIMHEHGLVVKVATRGIASKAVGITVICYI
jgi:hypothetical protein